MTFSGERSFKRGDILEPRNDEILYYNNEPIYVARSYNGKQHFAKNDDGHGLERGDITYAIAYDDRVKTWEETITTINENGDEVTETVTQKARFTPEEIEMIETFGLEYFYSVMNSSQQILKNFVNLLKN